MEKLGRLIPVDIYDKDGNMVRIEFFDSAGNRVIEAIWDQTDEQTNENRILFRKWAYNFMNNKGYEVSI